MATRDRLHELIPKRTDRIRIASKIARTETRLMLTHPFSYLQDEYSLTESAEAIELNERRKQRERSVLNDRRNAIVAAYILDKELGTPELRLMTSHQLQEYRHQYGLPATTPDMAVDEGIATVQS